MQTTTLQCHGCGAPARTDATACGHCGARLATIACPGCFGMMFLGSRFCPHCGERGDRWDQGAGIHECPTCRKQMHHTRVGEVDLQECAGCHGLWLDGGSVEHVVRTAESQTAVLHRFPSTSAEWAVEPVRYRRCPVCAELMNRRNFARSSGVVVDVCKAHGTWFDAEELTRVVDFVRVGGLERARRMEVEELEKRRRWASSPVPMGSASPPPVRSLGGNGWGLDIGDILGGIVSVAWDALVD